MPPRPLRPKDEPGVPEGSAESSDPKSSKRRAVSSACIPCRKRKSKCDGNLPSCSTCTAVYRTECYYDADSDHRRKGALRRDLQSLQQQNDALDVIVASLRSLPEDEAMALFHNLRTDTNPEALAASLRNNVRLPNNYAPQTLEADFAQQLSQSAPSSANTEQAPYGTFRSREQSMDGTTSTNDVSIQHQQPAFWFSVPQDPEFVDHLLNLYFTWVHPFYHFFSREHFLHDMNQGRTEFASAVLINAVLALACHYSDRPAARSDPDNSATAGDSFFLEAKRLLYQTERSCLCTVQALGVMSVRECSQGRDSNGYQYAGRAARMALELGLHLSVVASAVRPAEVEVRRITFWGVFNVETICSVGFGRLSQLPRAAADIQKPSLSNDHDGQVWRPYEDAVSTGSGADQTARPMLFIEHFSKLCELASDMVNTVYAPQERFTSRRLAAAYNQYQQWYRNLPDVFRLENTMLPHVLVLHMYYYACVLHLFRPYIKLDLRAANLFPRDTCTFCANEISNLMGALRAMYGLRRVCLAVASLVLSASTIHLLNLPAEPASSHLTQGMKDLQAMSTNHVFAGRCVEIIRSLAARWNIVLPDNVASIATLPMASQGTGLSPPISQFFMSSISRAQSSESGARSSGASSQQSQHPSPYTGASSGPPYQQQHYQAFYSEQTSPVDTLGGISAFWTPFPSQSMPMQSLPNANVGNEFSPNQQQSWTSLGQGQAGQQQHSASTGSRANFDENMEGPVEGWNWE